MTAAFDLGTARPSHRGFPERVARIRAVLADRDLDAIVLRRNPNVAWLLGARVHIPLVIDAAALDVVITDDDVRVVTNAIEANRFQAEELPDGVSLDVVPWTESRDGRLPTGPRVGSDQPGADRACVGADVDAARSTLVADDRERFRDIGADAARALGAVVKAVTPEDREIDVAAAVSAALWRADLEPVVLLVAGERRAPLMRHPMPTHDRIGAKVIASVCARRQGLIASVTRISVTAEIADHQAHEYVALLSVEAAMLDATRVGQPFAEPLTAAIGAYAATGLGEQEWPRHHQGGPTGYLPRDWPATPSSTAHIAAEQLVAWNPTAAGLKVEDTWLVRPDGPENLTLDPTWPTQDVAGRARPALWRR